MGKPLYKTLTLALMLLGSAHCFIDFGNIFSPDKSNTTTITNTTTIYNTYNTNNSLYNNTSINYNYYPAEQASGPSTQLPMVNPKPESEDTHQSATLATSEQPPNSVYTVSFRQQPVTSFGESSVLVQNDSQHSMNHTSTKTTINKNPNEPETIFRCVIAPGDPRRPLLTLEEMRPLVDNITEFALDLYHAFNFTNTNIVFSPLFISRSLAMVYAGASGTTADQMESALHFGVDRSIIHTAFQQYLEPYLPEVLKESNSLSIVNSLWSRLGVNFDQSYLDIMGFDYTTCVRQIDFEGEPEKSREMINDWVSNETHHAIQECIPDKSIEYFTSLILVTAVAFKGNFASPFDEKATANGTFTLLNGSSIEAPMMHRAGWYSYCSDDDYEAITIPYKGGQMFITFIAPNATEFDTFAATLSFDKVSHLLSQRDRQYLSLALPKFKSTSTLSLEDVLKQLGMIYPFTDEADFSGMTGKRNVKLSDVFHSAYVSVEEETGTETNGERSTPVDESDAGVEEPTNDTEPLVMQLNRPFIWIVHDPNDMIILMGQQIQP